jgi:hypothetical protein
MDSTEDLPPSHDRKSQQEEQPTHPQFYRECGKNGGASEVLGSYMFRKGRPLPPEPTEGTARKFTEVVRWIISVCVGLRKSQVRTLAELVAAALRMPRPSLAELGRRLAASTCKTAKHCIKRAWRFTNNERILIPEAMQEPLRWLFCQRWV